MNNKLKSKRLTMKIIKEAILFILLLSFGSHASLGTISFTGQIVMPPCQVKQNEMPNNSNLIAISCYENNKITKKYHLSIDDIIKNKSYFLQNGILITIENNKTHENEKIINIEYI